jgi:pimeloyl-ACP methyl ester carboxylesterase
VFAAVSPPPAKVITTSGKREGAMPTTRSTDGTEIAYEVAGEGAVDVLFLHGWAGSGRYFQQTAECLDPSRTRVITFDFRGHGDSGRSDSGYALDQLADDALAVADAAGSERSRGAAEKGVCGGRPLGLRA